MKSKKLALVCVTIGLLLALGIYSKTEAQTFSFPNVSDPNPMSLLFPVGEQVTFLKTGATTNNRYTLAKFVVPPGGGPMPHIHNREDEWFYVAEGNLQLGAGFNTYPDQNAPPGTNSEKEHYHTINAPAGTLIYTSRYHLHNFKNIGSQLLC